MNTSKERSKRIAFGAGAAGAIMGTLALLGTFQPGAGAEAGDTAATGDTPAESGGGGRNRHPQLSDEQKACLEEQGLTRPPGSAQGPPQGPPQGFRTGDPTVEQREKFEAAAEACGIDLPAHGPGHGNHPRLSDEQKACLEEQGLTRPPGSAHGPGHGQDASA